MKDSTHGLTIDQFKEIVEFAQTYHEFGRYHDAIERAGIALLYPKLKHLNIKYIDSVYDSRSAEIWLVCFRGMGRNKAFEVLDWEREKPTGTYFEWIMQYLKGEIE
jgi:hypothetical protein